MSPDGIDHGSSVSINAQSEYGSVRKSRVAFAEAATDEWQCMFTDGILFFSPFLSYSFFVLSFSSLSKVMLLLARSTVCLPKEERKMSVMTK